MIIRILMLAAAILLTGSGVAFTEKGTIIEGYRVMAYNARTHQYTIHGTFIDDGKCLVKKFVVVCSSYQSGKQMANRGATACDLPVGSFYPATATSRSRVLVTARNDYFAISERNGESVYQAFDVVSVEVLPDNGCR